MQKRSSPHPPVARQCLICGATFQAHAGALCSGGDKYCSRECYYKARGAGMYRADGQFGPGKTIKRLPKQGLIKEPHPPITVHCNECGKEVSKWFSGSKNKRHHFCDNECYHKWKADRHTRFWENVDKSGECWVWTAHRDRDGYGRFAVNGKPWGAHRFAYFLTHGDIPKGHPVCHKCDNPPCVRPDHLFAASNVVNIADRTQKGRSASGEKSWRRNHPETARGEKNPAAHLTPEQVIEIRKRYAVGGITQTHLAKEYGVACATINVAVNRKTWSHLP